MYRIITISVVLLFLTSCSSIKKIETFFTPVEREPLSLADPILEKLEPMKWIIITSENAQEVFAKLEEQGIDPVLFGLTDSEYQLVAKNFAQIRHNLKTKSEIIKAYQDYYEKNKDKPKDKEAK
tara:strand:+ start:155 stop:526 length:372 start_codon:yes stop_codon:yes gene_type:complete